MHARLTLSGEYVVDEIVEDRRIVLRPDTSPMAIRERAGVESVSEDDFERGFGRLPGDRGIGMPASFAEDISPRDVAPGVWFDVAAVSESGPCWVDAVAAQEVDLDGHEFHDGLFVHDVAHGWFYSLHALTF